MSDQIRISHGCLPWKPAADAEQVRVFDEYDIPLQGVLVQDGCLYLFDCLVGRMTRPGIWLYSLIGSDEFAELDAAEGQALDDLTLQIQRTRPAVVAVSFRGEGIVTSVEVWEMPEGFQVALDELKQRTQQWIEDLMQSKRELDQLGSPTEWERAGSAS